jgi:hypothetical protein
MSELSIPHRLHRVHSQKATLVNLGLYALAHGQWQMVRAITRLMQNRGWSHV